MRLKGPIRLFCAHGVLSMVAESTRYQGTFCMTANRRIIAILPLSLFFLITLLFSVFGCARNNPYTKEMAAYAERFATMASNKSFQVLGSPYVHVKRVPYDATKSRLLTRKLTMRVKAPLEEICDMLRRLVPIEVICVRNSDVSTPSERKVGKENADTESAHLRFEKGRAASRGNKKEEEDDLDSLLADLDPSLGALFREKSEQVQDERYHINYSGPLSGLLDQIAAQTGYGWEYQKENNTILFARLLTRTFFLKAPPGRVRYTSQVTNRSKENETKHASSRGNREEYVSQASQIAQTFEGDMAFDTFKDTLKTIRAMLSQRGRCEGNEAAGTITVSDHPENLRQISRYLAEINANFEKQVVMKVNVYALETNEETKTGFDLNLLLPNLQVLGSALRVVGNGTSLVTGTLGSAQATILDGTLKGSNTMLKALQSMGEARQITSAGIVALNNQPAPVEAISKTSYLAESSIETTEHGSETSLTPGEVTTGFSMTITPHILSNRNVLLQYHVHLSSLDAMESFESRNARIQLPKVSSRAFSQKARMMMGQTLVLAGFQEAGNTTKGHAGLFSLAREKKSKSSLIIVTIEVENAAPDNCQKS